MTAQVPPGVQPAQDGRLQCLECGRWYRSLAAHVNRSEDMTAARYRERHGLPATLPLVSPELSELWSEQAKDRLAARELISVEEHDPAKRRRAGRSGTTRHSETAVRPGVRTAHQDGIVKGRTRAHENARDVLHGIATDLGYTGWEDLIRQTKHLGVHACARLVGRDAKTVAYWRSKILGEGWKISDGRLQPRRAAAYARLDADFARRGWPDLETALAQAGSLKAVAKAVHSTARVLREWDSNRKR
ncbi:MucR family transcriptional regulator [Nonomuraea fuscirosea]